MVLLAFFAGAALLLTTIGLYGLVNYTLQQRTREIGIRVALGATPARVQSQFLRQGVLLTVFGLLLGVTGAAAGVTLLRSLLYGVQPYDGASFATAVAVIAAAALLASWIPARRASYVDPLVALQAE